MKRVMAAVVFLALCASQVLAQTPLPQIATKAPTVQKTHLVPAVIPDQGHKRRAIIFDVDDTLTKVVHRNRAIFREIGRELNIPQLKDIRIREIKYACGDTLKNVGVTDAQLTDRICGGSDLIGRTKGEWGKRFFTESEYQRFDQPMGGGRRMIVRLINRTRADIIYLTGRIEDFVRTGTEDQLARLRMPGYDGEKYPVEVQLIMKPFSDPAGDAEWKAQKLEELKKQYTIIAAFDDSKANSAVFRKGLPPQVPVVRPTANVADADGVAPGVEQITNYKINKAVDTYGQTMVGRNNLEFNDLINRMNQVQEY